MSKEFKEAVKRSHEAAARRDMWRAEHDVKYVDGRVVITSSCASGEKGTTHAVSSAPQ